MRSLTFFILLAAATLIAGFYGSMHDQIAYSISPEFFNILRFPKYNIDTLQAGRWEVAKVGFLQTLPVGFVLGIIISLVGLLHKENKDLFKLSLQSFVFAMLTAFLFALLSLPMPVEQSPDMIQSNVSNINAFLKVERMNNAAHVGALLGMFVGIAWQVFHLKRKIKHNNSNNL